MKDFLKDQEFQQKVTYESQLFAFNFFHTSVRQGQPDILFHWHPELEISYVYEGSASYHIDNFDYFSSQPGDIILMRPNALHSIHPIGDLPHETDSLQFHLDTLGAGLVDRVSLHYLQPLQQDKFQFVPRIQPGDPGYESIKDCLFAIFDTIRQEDRHFELLLKAQFFQLLHLLFFHRHVVKKTTDDMYRKNEQIRDLIEFIQDHYQEDLSIERLADHMGYSKTHFMTVFKQHTGTSCTDFVIQVRLRKACQLLTNTVQPILAIAHAVGFNNLSNFNRQFKHYYQVTPSQYRKERKQTAANH